MNIKNIMFFSGIMSFVFNGTCFAMGQREYTSECNPSAALIQSINDLDHESDLAYFIDTLNADINFVDTKGLTPLIHALKRNRAAKIIIFLIIKGANVNYVHEENQKNVLNYAKNKEIRRILKACGAKKMKYRAYFKIEYYS